MKASDWMGRPDLASAQTTSRAKQRTSFCRKTRRQVPVWLILEVLGGLKPAPVGRLQAATLPSSVQFHRRNTYVYGTPQYSILTLSRLRLQNTNSCSENGSSVNSPIFACNALKSIGSYFLCALPSNTTPARSSNCAFHCVIWFG